MLQANREAACFPIQLLPLANRASACVYGCRTRRDRRRSPPGDDGPSTDRTLCVHAERGGCRNRTQAAGVV